MTDGEEEEQSDRQREAGCVLLFAGCSLLISLVALVSNLWVLVVWR